MILRVIYKYRHGEERLVATRPSRNLPTNAFMLIARPDPHGPLCGPQDDELNTVSHQGMT